MVWRKKKVENKNGNYKRAMPQDHHPHHFHCLPILSLCSALSNYYIFYIHRHIEDPNFKYMKISKDISISISLSLCK